MAMSRTGKLRWSAWSDGLSERRPGPAARPVSRIAGVAVLLVVLCAGFVGQRVYVMNLTYRLEAELARAREVARQNEFLQLEVARARSLDRIEAVARGRLGMVPAEHRDVVVIPGEHYRAGAEPSSPAPAAPRPAAEGWLASFLEWADGRWPGRTAEAGSK